MKVIDRFKGNKSLALYYLAKLIREAETAIATRYSEGKMRCPTHLSIGQEGVSAGVGAALESTDFAVSSHRGHGHYLGKGGSLKHMIAEIYGKQTGCSGGVGGSMHLVDRSVGFMGTTAIVGNSIPVGVGLGFSQALDKTDGVTAVFFGDGAVEEGAFYESVNFSALKKLPILYVCENNLYSVYSPLSVRQPKDRQIYKMVAEMGVDTTFCDGNNIDNVYDITSEKIKNIRNGEGPAFIEFSTYRWREHCGPNFDNDIGYRTTEEYESWKSKDPLAQFETTLKKSGRISSEEIAEISKTIDSEIEEAFEFAENSPEPEWETVKQYLYHGES